MKIICLIGFIFLLSNSVLSQDILLDNDYTKWSNSPSLNLSSNSEFIQVQFNSQPKPMFEIGSIYRSINISKIPTRISFKFKYFNKKPSAVRVYLQSENNNVWFKNIIGIKEWENNIVHVNFENWVMGSINQKLQFDQDIQKINYVGVSIVRDASMEPQTYGIDRFIITYCETQQFFSDIDSDGDGILDKDEYIAGTDPFDIDSLFMLKIEKHDNIKLSWNSSTGRIYDIYYTTNLFVPFSILRSGIIAEPPHNLHIDDQQDNQRYYKIVVY